MAEEGNDQISALKHGSLSQCTASSKKNCVVVPTWNSWESDETWPMHRTAWSIWSISLVESLQSIHSCTHVVLEHFASHLLKSNKQRKHIAESFMPFFKRAWPRGHFCRAWMTCFFRGRQSDNNHFWPCVLQEKSLLAAVFSVAYRCVQVC